MNDKIVKLKMPDDVVSIVSRDRIKLAHIRKYTIRPRSANQPSDSIVQKSDIE